MFRSLEQLNEDRTPLAFYSANHWEDSFLGTLFDHCESQMNGGTVFQTVVPNPDIPDLQHGNLFGSQAKLV
jgi:hypothetical protein